MDRYTIDSYAKAMTRIEQNGYLFDTGQIAPSVLTQLYLNMRSGKLKSSRDTWPIRGLTQDGKCPVRTVWELVRVEELA